MKTNEEVVDLIIEITKNKNISQSELARRVDMAKSAISRYFNKTRELPINRISDFAKALNVEPEYLLGIEEISKNNTVTKITEIANKLIVENQNKTLDFAEELLKKQNDTIIEEEKEEYILNKIWYTEKVSAGTGYSYGDNEQEYVYTDRDDLPAYDFATMVSGDSMIPDYNFGDIVLVRQGYDNVNGDVYVIDYDGESFIKKVFNHGTHFILRSINEEYKDIIIYLSELEDTYFNIVGKVIDSFTPVERN